LARKTQRISRVDEMVTWASIRETAGITAFSGHQFYCTRSGYFRAIPEFEAPPKSITAYIYAKRPRALVQRSTKDWDPRLLLCSTVLAGYDTTS